MPSGTVFQASFMESLNFSNTAYIYQKIFELISGQFFPSLDSINELLLSFLRLIGPLSLVLSLLFLTGIIYCVIRIRVVFHELEEGSHGAHQAGAHIGASHDTTAPSSNRRWVEITNHIGSDSPSDWRLAILECDIILDEMLTKMSYHGETLSDKLKTVEKSDFLSIDKAWEAHRVRNAVAHEGSNFKITDREARRVVGLYEEVFREFHYI